jgi:hypothetical protein
VRKNSRPDERAGVARQNSFNRLHANTSKSRLARSTNTSPNSPVKYTFPSAATGEAVNPWLRPFKRSL